MSSKQPFHAIFLLLLHTRLGSRGKGSAPANDEMWYKSSEMIANGKIVELTNTAVLYRLYVPAFEEREKNVRWQGLTSCLLERL